MKNWILRIYYFLQLLILFQNIDFIIFHFTNYNILYNLNNKLIGYLFFVNYFSGIVLFFWTFFYIRKFKWSIILFIINIILEYFFVLYLVGDSI
jgi:hypothetical protein